MADVSDAFVTREYINFQNQVCSERLHEKLRLGSVTLFPDIQKKSLWSRHIAG